ncbi:MAG: AAA family ATPase [bacterium]
MHVKRLSTNISTFRKIITENCIYVDKTKQIYQLFKEKSQYYFLSRPRRFGKSLLVSTLEELFKGNKDLFKELWICSSNFEWLQHPIVHLDFLNIPHSDPETLKQGLIRALVKIAAEYGYTGVEQASPEEALKSLVEKLSTQNSIVLLIDEYDKPILDHLHNIAIAEKQRTILKGFYEAVKSLDRYWRAVFITGVSRFSKTSIFSGFNSLNDISEKPVAAELLGYTQAEIEQYFSEYVSLFSQEKNVTQQFLMDEMKTWYDGYRFCGDLTKEPMYNPFSVLYYLQDKKRANYWFNSGTPSFLIELLKQNPHELSDMDNIFVTPSELGTIDIHNINRIVLFYQTGYLTIKDFLIQGSSELFMLGYPNQEVAQSVTTYLTSILANIDKSKVESVMFFIKKALVERDIALFCKSLKTLWANIPYNLHIPREAYYHSLLQNMCNLLGIDVQSEVLTSNGRLDLIITTNIQIFIFELKFKECADMALQQIFDKRYYEKYLLKNKPITLVGLSFSFKDKNLDLEWVSQEYKA